MPKTPHAELPEHKGTRRYSLWFSDMNGIEDFLTILMTWKQANELQDTLEAKKAIEDNPTISDFVLHLDEPETYADAVAYIADKLRDDDEE